MQVFLFIVGILSFVGLVVIHELGHFWAAQRAGVQAEEFGIGLPPRAWAKKLPSGTLFSLNWLPLGGFVRLRGEHDGDSAAGSFGKVSLRSKTRILLAGIFMNLLAGFLILTVLAAAGMPVLIDNQFTVGSDTKISRQEVRVGDILPGSPATKTIDSSGHVNPLRSQDLIGSIADTKTGQSLSVKTPDQLKAFTQAHQNDPVELVIVRNDKPVNLTTTLSSHLGVVPFPVQLQRSTWSAPLVAGGLTGQVISLSAQGFWHAIGGLGSAIAGLVTHNHTARVNGQAQASDQVGGPVAIVNILWQNDALGINYILAIIAVISITLAIVNILPIPALDGGRLFVILLFRAMKRRLLPETEDLIHGLGMAALLTLFVLITIVDVKRFY